MTVTVLISSLSTLPSYQRVGVDIVLSGNSLTGQHNYPNPPMFKDESMRYFLRNIVFR